MDVRYQVFVSSTFVDLKEERSAVFQTLMEMDCIPAGMELFPAMDDEQWNFIKRIVDDCDYYILILGSRYGSVSEAGISYTEMEYDYAINKGLKVLAFVHEHPDHRPANLADGDPILKEKLDNFRKKVCTGRLVKFWNETKELPGLVALSLNKTIRTYPAVGWVRANRVASDAVFEEQNALLREIRDLKQKLAQYENESESAANPGDLAGLDDAFGVSIYWTEYGRTGRATQHLKEKLTWGEIFRRVAPDLEAHPSDAAVNYALGKSVLKIRQPDHKHSVNVESECFKTIRVHLQALGLIKAVYSGTTKGDTALFWNLTDAGRRLLVQLRSVKRNDPANKPTSE